MSQSEGGGYCGALEEMNVAKLAGFPKALRYSMRRRCCKANNQEMAQGESGNTFRTPATTSVFHYACLVAKVFRDFSSAEISWL